MHAKHCLAVVLRLLQPYEASGMLTCQFVKHCDKLVCSICSIRLQGVSETYDMALLCGAATESA